MKKFETIKRKIVNNKGITLVALVISIVVLLILSMVSVNALIGENGIISRAKDSRELTLLADMMFDLESNIVDMNIDSILDDRVLTGTDKLYELWTRRFFTNFSTGELRGFKIDDDRYNKGLSNLVIGYNGDVWLDNYKRGKVNLSDHIVNFKSTDQKTTITVIDGDIEEVSPNRIYYLHAFDDPNFSYWLDKNGEIVSIYPNTMVRIVQPREEEYTAVYNGFNLFYVTNAFLYGRVSDTFELNNGIGILSNIEKTEDNILTIEVNSTHWDRSFLDYGTLSWRGTTSTQKDMAYWLNGYGTQDVFIYISPDLEEVKNLSETVTTTDRVGLLCVKQNGDSNFQGIYNYKTSEQTGKWKLYGYAPDGKGGQYPVFTRESSRFFTAVDMALWGYTVDSLKQYFASKGYENVTRLYYRAGTEGLVYDELPMTAEAPGFNWYSTGKILRRLESDVKFIDI